MTVEKSKLAVIMPVYNAEKFLQQSIDSILQQSFADFEFLICDDCSVDDSAEILRRAALTDKRVKLFRNEKNSGVTYSLNRLLQEVSSPFIVRMDADDIALPDRLKKQYEFMQNHPEVAVAGGDLEIIDENNNTLGMRYYLRSWQEIKKQMMCRSPLAHPAVIMRKSVIDRLGGYLEQPGCEDYYLWLRIVENGYELANLPETLLRYRLSAHQIKQRDMKKSLLSTIRLQKKYIFKRGFFSIKAFCVMIAEYGLLLLPDKLILKLFSRVTYK
ncbi:MAG: glycosyltransferase [Lentisphaeria bacterium]|nr:glycosyltransferase [Lentisphaeria bacterium]